MSKYIKLDDATERTNQLFHGYEVEAWLNSLPTIEVSEDDNILPLLGDEYMCEDAISKAYLEQEIEREVLSDTEPDIHYGWNKALDKVVEIIENAPSVVPKTERLCDNCEYYGGGEVCDHPSIGEVEMGGKGDTFPWIKETPKWCPLKGEPQTDCGAKMRDDNVETD